MGKHSKRRSEPRTPRRRTGPPPKRRLGIRAAVIAGVLAVAVVVLALVVLAGQRPPLPGIETGAPPWPPEIAHLADRIRADGLRLLTAEGQAQHTHQHLDLYVDGIDVPVPVDIGIDLATGTFAPIHTHDASGIIHVESTVVRTYTLGEFFDVWGVRFDAHCVAGICDGGGRTLSVYVDGRPFGGDPRSIVLTAHEEIVVAIGTPAELPSPVPSTYTFPPGL